MLLRSASVVAIAACLMFAAQAQAADAPSLAADSNEVDQVVVIGSGQTRSVSTLLPQNLDVLPPAPASRRR